METAFPLILASASRGRKNVLSEANIAFEAHPSEIDESAFPERHPRTRSLLLAREKAQSVARLHPDRWVVGCDTVVEASNGELLEKPTDQADAERMIRLQSAAVSTVYTGMCLIGPRRASEERPIRQGVDAARVKFFPLSDAAVQAWMASRHWEGCAGAFPVEVGYGRIIEAIEGDKTTVIGFSMTLFRSFLEEFGYAG